MIRDSTKVHTNPLITKSVLHTEPAIKAAISEFRSDFLALIGRQAEADLFNPVDDFNQKLIDLAYEFESPDNLPVPIALTKILIRALSLRQGHCDVECAWASLGVCGVPEEITFPIFFTLRSFVLQSDED